MDDGLEELVKLVMAKGLATGHANSAKDLMVEVLDQYQVLMDKYLALAGIYASSQ